MAATTKFTADETRRTTLSPRPKGRENAKNTLCRNITIYGHCRWEDKGCAFNHDPSKVQTSQSADRNRKRLNVDSPSFTPALLSSPTSNTIKKTTTISPKAASAAPFQPKTSGASGLTTPKSTSWSVHDVTEFQPQAFESLSLGNGPNALAVNSYDPFTTTPLATPSNGITRQTQSSLNLYQDASSLAPSAFYSNPNSYQMPAQYHLYAPWGPYKERLQSFQKPVRDFFIPDNLREELEKKNHAALQVLPNLTLRIDPYHTLVPLDTNNIRNATLFGYPSWVYKAISSNDGKTYAIRRIEGFRMTNDKAIRPMHTWKRIVNSSIVTVHEAFTTRAFGDSSLLFVTDFHPLSKTLTEAHFGPPLHRYQGRNLSSNHVPEQVLWAYIVQMASALSAIHSNNLAARIIDPSKILLSERNRIRLNACAILDVVQYETQPNIQQLQQHDFVLLGRLILAIGSNNINPMQNLQKAQEQFSRYYTATLTATVSTLMDESQQKDPSTLIQHLSIHTLSNFDSTLHFNDQLNSELSREIENGRLLRLMTKLNFINERPEYEHDMQWSEHGTRYFIKLFRDYVFHQVDAQGNPSVDMGHVLLCMNKLDAGVEEKVELVSRDSQSSFIVSYRELKTEIERAFQELLKPSRATH
ncbi:MAG: PAB-dependent poly(A)-specific ribonuclease subunit 3 [Cirrosporium novae-zelandiae]|nr:MAG: PAB-dependent poly(A)-specific ribonuclease subunit 3 [Cirrosporium novae-zelandiae]